MELLPAVTAERRPSSEDVRRHAKHETGPSVRRPRSHGLTRERIHAMVEALGWNILVRPPQPGLGGIAFLTAHKTSREYSNRTARGRNEIHPRTVAGTHPTRLLWTDT